MADEFAKTNLADDEQLIKQNLLVREWKKRQLCVEVKRNANIADTMVQTQLNRLRGQYTELKNSTRYQQTLLLLLQELSSRDIENSHDETAALQAKRKTSAANVQSLKIELQDSRTHIEELADTAEKYYAEYQTLLGQLEERVQAAEEKRAHIIEKQQEVQRRLAALGSNISARDDVEVSIKEKTNECRSMQESLRGVQEAIATNNLLLPKLKADCRQLEMEAGEVRCFLDDLHTGQNAVTGSIQAQINWCEELQGLLETVSGVQETHVTGSSVTLQILNPLSPPQQQPVCTLTINVSLTKCASYKLETAHVSPETLDVTEIITTAIQKNDVRLLVTDVQTTWIRHMPLVQEIETLRKKFALDWLPTENLLTVLFGNEASIVVQLHIDPGYPASGGVTILSAVGLPEGTTVSQLQLPCSGSHCLTDWLEHLGKKLQPCFPAQ
ncbi:hypothetical protein LSAT2_007303 [Lamellibrachia satsuma]|nr:hypothetical protein LSAT2_007303 [Lamellibrachia satsuma]